MFPQQYCIAGSNMTCCTRSEPVSPLVTGHCTARQGPCACHETSPPPDVLFCEHRPGPHASYQDAVQAWQEKHDDAALMAIADRVGQQQQFVMADELHASAQVRRSF